MPELLLAIDAGHDDRAGLFVFAGRRAAGAGCIAGDFEITGAAGPCRTGRRGDLADDAAADPQGAGGGEARARRCGRHRDHHPAHQPRGLGWAHRPAARADGGLERPARRRTGLAAAGGRLSDRAAAGGGQAGAAAGRDSGRHGPRRRRPTGGRQYRRLPGLEAQRRRSARHRPQPGLADGLSRSDEPGLEQDPAGPPRRR